MALLIVWIWPEYQPVLSNLEELFENPIFATIIGEAAIDLGITSFEGFLSLELFIMSDLVFLFLFLQFSATSVAEEARSGTLDVMLSYPVPRWQFLLEKLLAMITLTVAYPLFVWGAAVWGAIGLNIEFNNSAILAGLVGKWILYLTFACIAMFCSVLFMEPTKARGASGFILVGSFMLERIGGLIRAANTELADLLQGASLFHHLDGSTIMNAVINDELLPLGDIGFVITIGLVAFLGALILFQNREFTP
jgi:ABC-2 type transport system permease protein